MNRISDHADHERYLAPVPPDGTDVVREDAVEPALADERVVHALLRSLAPGEHAATMARVDRAMTALLDSEQERFTWRMRRAFAPWMARGAAAAAMLLMAAVVTRIATTPSPAFAELAAITSATQSMPFRRYAVVIEQRIGPDQVARRHGTLDLGPDDRFVFRVAPRAEGNDGAGQAERRMAPDGAIQRLMQNEAMRERLRTDDSFRQRLMTDPQFREQTLREFMREESAEPDSRRRGDDPATDRRQRERGAARNQPREGQRNPQRDGDRADAEASNASPQHRLRPPRGRFDPHATFGHDGTDFWLVSAAGPTFVSASAQMLQGRNELNERLDHLILDQVLDRLRRGYRLEHVQVDEFDPETGRTDRLVRIRATRSLNAQARPARGSGLPDLVIVRARSSDRVVVAFEAEWNAPDSAVPNRRIGIELLNDPPPASFSDLSWFKSDAHHDDDRPIVRIDVDEGSPSDDRPRDRRAPRPRPPHGGA